MSIKKVIFSASIVIFIFLFSTVAINYHEIQEANTKYFTEKSERSWLQEFQSSKGLKKMEKYEQMRMEEEINIQLGLGLSEELKEYYEEVSKKYAEIQEIYLWSQYRLAEYEYSRNMFDDAVNRLIDNSEISEENNLVKDIVIESYILASDVLSSPYNPNQDVKEALNILNVIEEKYPNNNRVKVAKLNLKNYSETNMLSKVELNEKISIIQDVEFMNFIEGETPIDKVNKQNYNNRLALALKHIAQEHAENGDTELSLEVVNEVIETFPSEDDMFDYFTSTSTLEMFKFQKALLLVMNNEDEQAILELENIISAHQESHLAIRSQEILDTLLVPTVSTVSTNISNTTTTNTLDEFEILANSCGPLSLQVALAKLGHNVELDVLINQAGTTKDGTTMSGLIHAANEQGYSMYGVKLMPSDLYSFDTPIILLLHEHYIVIEKISDREVTVFDPLIGTVKMDVSNIVDRWTGYGLVFGDNEAEVVNQAKGAIILQYEETKKLTGKYLCSNVAGGPGSTTFEPCVNFETSNPNGDGFFGGFDSIVHRVHGNHHLSSPPLLLAENPNTSINMKIFYNSQAQVNSSVGFGWSLSYSDHLIVLRNNDIQWVSGDGTRITFMRNIDGTFTSPPGVHDKLIKTNDNEYKIYRHNLEEMSFSQDGLLTSIIDPLGKGIDLAYDTNGNLKRVTDKQGIEVNFKHNSQGKLIEISDKKHVVNFEYEDEQLMKLIYPEYEYSFGYNNKLLTEFKDFLGVSTYFKYNSGGQIIGRTNALGDEMSIIASGDKFTNYFGYEKVFTLRRTDLVVTSITDELGGKTQYRFNADRKIIEIIDPLSNSYKYEYDARGNISTITDPLGNKTHNRYNEKNLLISETDSLGRTTNYDYDEKGKLIRITNPNGKSQTYQYDKKGNITSVIDFAGATTHYKYDEKGWLIEIKNSIGNSIKYEYDDLGYKVAEIDALGYKTNYKYNHLGLVTEILYPDSSEEVFYYFGQLLTKHVDRNGGTTSYSYDDLGRLTESIDPEGNQFTYVYDKEGQVITITSPNGGSVNKTYDKKGRLIKNKYQDNLEETFEYDSADRLVKETLPNGGTIEYSYDALGRVIKKVSR